MKKKQKKTYGYERGKKEKREKIASKKGENKKCINEKRQVEAKREKERER